jgi:phage terminase large subunit
MLLKPPDTVVRVELRGANWELMRAREPEVLVSSAAGTGKSVAALTKLHLNCMQTAGVRCLLLRKTHNSLTSSTLVTFRKQVAAEALARGDVHWYGGSGSEPAAYRYSNGSVIVAGGLDKPSKLLSTDYDLVLIDEATETTADDIDTVITRLRNGVLPYQQLIMLCNPGAPTHHLKQRADAGRCRIIYGRHENNPRMWQGGAWTEYGSSYLSILETLTGVRRARFLLGQWTAAEGLVYEGFDPAVHLRDPFQPPMTWTRWWSVDFGYRNPFVCQMWAEDPDGRLYLYREIYQTGQLVEDLVPKIIKTMKTRDGVEPWPRAIICDHDAEDRATLERHLGRSTVAAKKDVSEGIQAVQERLRIRGDGKPSLYICRDALVQRDQALTDAHKPACTQDEIVEYVWDDRNQPGTGTQRETPRKENDHGCDAMRYVVAQVDLVGRPRVRFFN